MKKINTKKLAKGILFLTLILFSVGISSAQDGANRKGRGEKIKQLKIAYFTEELALTSSESEKFWPIYNELEEKIKISRKENKKIIDDLSTTSETLKDEDFKKNVNKMFDNDISETTIRKDYYLKIAQVIGYKKATKLLKLEKEFKKKLLMELKKRKKEMRGK